MNPHEFAHRRWLIDRGLDPDLERRFLESKGASRARIFVEKLPLSEEEHQLLEKILYAMNLRFHEVSLQERSCLESCRERHNRVIAFLDHVQDGPQGAIFVPSLKAMLSDPLRKREAWNVLKSLR